MSPTDRPHAHLPSKGAVPSFGLVRPTVDRPPRGARRRKFWVGTVDYRPTAAQSAAKKIYGSERSDRPTAARSAARKNQGRDGRPTDRPVPYGLY